MTHLRTTIIQTYFNSFNITTVPPCLIQLCVSQDHPSPRQTTEKKQPEQRSTKKPSVFRFQSRNPNKQLMNSYLELNINTLTNLNSSECDFQKDSGMVHALQFKSQSYNQLEELQTVISVYGDDTFSTKFESSFKSEQNLNESSFLEDTAALKLTKLRKLTQ